MRKRVEEGRNESFPFVNLMKNSGFHAVFGDEENKDVVIGVLNMMLPPHRHVTDITYLKTEHHGKLPKNKEYRYDFMCSDQSGARYIVELQCYPEKFWFRRCVSYCCRAYDRGNKRGKESNGGTGYNIPPVYLIGFMGTKVNHPDEDEWKDRFISEYTFREKTSHDLQDETITIIFAEMVRFNKSAEECTTAQEKLLYLIKNIGKLNDDPNWDSDAFWQRFVGACEIAGFNENKRIEYEMAINDERQKIGQFQAHWELGHDEGLKEGLQEGVAKGRDEERINIARNCKEMGMDAASIAKVTGLSETEIAGL